MEQEIPDKQPGEALREMLARSQQISGQVPTVMQQPMPPVVLSQEIGLSSEGERERKNYFTAARYLGIAGVIMLLSPFIYAALLSGYHGNNEDGLVNCSPLVGLRNQTPTNGECFYESTKFSVRGTTRTARWPI